MKSLFIAVALAFSLSVAAEQPQVSNQGNSNVTNICQPKVIVKQQQCQKCKTKCTKPKVIYKTRYRTKTVVKEKPVIKKQIVVVKPKEKKNMLRLLGGYGPDGVSAARSGNSAVARQDDGFVWGVGYSRKISGYCQATAMPEM